MFVQSVMLLLRAEEIDVCAQIACAEYHEAVAEVVEPADDLALACGMSIGYADPSVPRAWMPDAVTFKS